MTRPISADVTVTGCPPNDSVAVAGWMIRRVVPSLTTDDLPTAVNRSSKDCVPVVLFEVLPSQESTQKWSNDAVPIAEALLRLGAIRVVRSCCIRPSPSIEPGDPSAQVCGTLTNSEARMPSVPLKSPNSAIPPDHVNPFAASVRTQCTM